eukprot:Hpha_TRINITY_DN15597_c4_g3::TRINITY_DN15597_c4_g3_i2::g.108434::m.108434
MRQSAALLLCMSTMLGKALADGGDAGGDDTYDPPSCDSAWAKGGLNDGLCFQDHPSPPSGRWGWTNKIANQPGTTLLELWAGAGQCNTSKGELIGSVMVVVTATDVIVTYTVSGSVNFEEYHVYIGRSKWYYKSTATGYTASVSPGQFPLPEAGHTGNTVQAPIPADCGDHFYVMAHAKVCTPETPCPPTPEPAPPSLSPIKV